MYSYTLNPLLAPQGLIVVKMVSPSDVPQPHLSLIRSAVNRSSSRQRSLLQRQLDERAISARTAENKHKTSSTSKDASIADLRSKIETLNSEVRLHGTGKTSCDDALALAEGSLRAEVIKSTLLRRKVELAQAAEHNQKSALGQCELALERAKAGAALPENVHKFSEAVADADPLEWDDSSVAHISHPKDKYDHPLRDGTSHHLAQDTLEMEGLEEEETLEFETAELEVDAPEPEPERVDEPAPEPAEKEPPRFPAKQTPPLPAKQTQQKPDPKRNTLNRKPVAKSTKTRGKPPPTAADLSKRRRQARQSLFASAEM